MELTLPILNRAAIAVSAFCALLLGGCASTDFEVARMSRVIVPPETATLPADPFTVEEDGFVMRAPIGVPVGAALTEPVAAPAGSATLPEGTLLEIAFVTAGTSEYFSKNTISYCTIGDEEAAQAFMHAIGLYGADEKEDERADLCFGGSSGETAFDFVFRSRVKDAENIRVVEIDPVSFEPRLEIPLGEDHEARIQFDGALSGDRDRISFEFEVIRFGRAQEFTSAQLAGTLLEEPRVRISRFGMPTTVTLLGTSFEVLAFDPEAETVEVRLLKGIPTGPYRLMIPQPSQIMIYMPGD